MPAPPTPSLFDHVVSSAWNYWLALVIDVLAAAALVAIGVRLSDGVTGAVITAAAGASAWSVVEYAMHRWVLHGPSSAVQRAHARHHRHAESLISAPVFLSTSLAVALWIGLSAAVDAGPAALTVGGLYCGYNYYALLHHVQHHYPGLVARLPWLTRLDRAHRLHHRFYVVNYGVTTGWCDRLFRSDVRSSPAVARHVARSATRPR